MARKKQTTQAGTVVTRVGQELYERRREISCILVMFSSAFAVASLLGWNPLDHTWYHPVLTGVVTNPCGPLGANVADYLYRYFGSGAWGVLAGFVVPVFVLARRPTGTFVQWLLGAWLFAMSLGLIELGLAMPTDGDFSPGGYVGAFVSGALVNVVGRFGAWIVLLAAVTSAGSMLLQVSWSRVATAVMERLDIAMPVVREQARSAGGTMGAWLHALGGMILRFTWAALQALWRGLVALVTRITIATRDAVVGAGGRLRIASSRMWHALNRTEEPWEDDWEQTSGLEALSPSIAEPESFVTGEGLATAAVGAGTSGWSPRTSAAAAELLEMFPGMAPRSAAAAAVAADPGTSWGEPAVPAKRAPRRPAPAPAPVPTVGVPLVTSAAPAPVVAAPAPVVAAPVPVAAAPAPVVATPAPVVATPAPVVATPVPVAAAPAPVPVAPAPAVAPVAPSIAPAPAPIQPAPAPEAPQVPDSEFIGPRRLQVEKVAGLEERALDDGQAVSDHGDLYFELPRLSLLDEVPEQRATINESELAELAKTVEDTLASFKVTGSVTNVRVGPVVTTFEFLPDAGISVRKIGGLSDDLAMALKALSVRIVAPIPGKGVVGIETPSQTRLTIFFRELLAAEVFRKSEAALPMVIGKDVEGMPVVADLAKMPHLLVGGTTGSGKSVGVNGMLLSMLYTRTPEELRLLLVDPKILEFDMYADVPHLLHPVVTEPDKAAAALAWACREMDRRYELMNRWKTKSIITYNAKVLQESRSWSREKAVRYAPKGYQPGDGAPPNPEQLPYIVIVIDELADLMMTAKKDVQESIVRIAQKARACGMHLIIATQRPSVDVVTGLIKSNLPGRIAFQLRSGIDSRTILDCQGAEKLLGRGDMLFLPGAGAVKRCHGAWVSETEILRVVEFLKAQREPDYLEGITVNPESLAGQEVDEEDHDALLDDAINFVIGEGKCSTSMVQRRFKIGYNRAARIVDTMEMMSVVGPADGARPRKVLVQPSPE